MALSKQCYIFSVKQLKIYPLTQDDETTLTYGTGIEIPQAKKLTFKPTYETYKCKHNGKTTDQVIDLIEGEWALDCNLLDLDVLTNLEGDTLTTSGAAETEVHELELNASSQPPYFKIEAKVKYTGKNSTVKDAHIILHKCIANGPETNLEDAAYSSFPASGQALITVNGGANGKLRTLKLYAQDTELTA